MERLVDAYLSYHSRDSGDGMPTPQEVPLDIGESLLINEIELVDIFSKFEAWPMFLLFNFFSFAGRSCLHLWSLPSHQIATNIQMKHSSTMDTSGVPQCILPSQYHFAHLLPIISHTECVPDSVSNHNARLHVFFMMYIQRYVPRLFVHVELIDSLSTIPENTILSGL